MSVLLTKKLVREIAVPWDWQKRNIILEIEPNGLVSFREKGRRRRWTIGIAWLKDATMRKIAEANRPQPKKRMASRGIISLAKEGR